MSIVGENIKRKRTELGISQYRLSKISGIAQSTLSAIESSTKNPSTETLKLIANSMGCTVAELMGETEKAATTESDDRKAKAQMLFNALSDSLKEEALSYMEYLSARKDK